MAYHSINMIDFFHEKFLSQVFGCIKLHIKVSIRNAVIESLPQNRYQIGINLPKIFSLMDQFKHLLHIFPYSLKYIY